MSEMTELLSQIVQLSVIVGAFLIVGFIIHSMKGHHINMRSHHKIQALALTGLTLIGVVALIGALSFTDNLASFIGVASAAVGGIAGFITHKLTTPNKTVLFPIKDQYVKAGDTLEFSVAGISTAGYNLNYDMSSDPILPESAKFNKINGEFSWKPEEGGKDYNVTFTVSDGQGGTDSRTIKIIVGKKKDQSGQELTTQNRTVLLPIEDQHVGVGSHLNFSVKGSSTAGYNLNYDMSSQPALPEGAEFDKNTGEFKWIPQAGGKYDVTFTVSDVQGGTDSRTIKIIVG